MNTIKICILDAVNGGSYALISESEVYSKTDSAPAVVWDCIKEKYIDESSETFLYRNKYAYEKDTLNNLDRNFGMTLYTGAQT